MAIENYTLLGFGLKAYMLTLGLGDLSAEPTGGEVGAIAETDLQRAMATSIDDAIVGKHLGDDGNMFIIPIDPDNPRRDLNCWLLSLPVPTVVTGQSYWNNARGAVDNFKQHGCLISRQIMVLAGHYSPPAGIGAEFRWCSAAEVVYSRTIVDQRIVSSELVLSKLSSPLPADIVPFTVLPDDWHYYLPGQPLRGSPDSSLLASRYRSAFPVMESDQLKRAKIYEWFGEFTNDGGTLQVSAPLDPERLLFWQSGLSGDSGACVLLLPGDGQQVLLITASSNSIWPNIAAINAAILEMVPDGSAAVTRADFSAFNVYDEFGGWTAPDVRNGWLAPGGDINGWTVKETRNGWTVPA